MNKKYLFFAFLFCIVFISSVSAFNWTDNSLISYYKLDESSGNILDSIYANNGTTINVIYSAPGKINTALNFTGSNSNVNITNQINLATSASFSFWVRKNGTNAGGILSKRYYHAFEPSQDWLINYQSDNVIAVILWGVTPTLTTYTGFLPLNTWIHVVVTYNGSNISIYKNGILNISVGATGTIRNNNYQTRIADDHWESGFNGTIDEVGIWNKSFVQQNVTDLYNGGAGLAYLTVGGDTTPPYFTTIPANSSLFYLNGTILAVFAATDETNFGYYSVNDSRFIINQTGFLSNVSSNLAVGNYEINVTINDTSNNLNWTRYKVQINKSSYYDCSVFFNASSPITYPATFTANTNCSSTYTLKLNGTSIANGSVVNSGVGYYNISVFRTDTLNYSNTFDQQFFTINQNAENCQVKFNVTSPIYYPNTFLAWHNCTTTSTLKRNDTIISNNSEQSLAVGTYNFSMFRTDNINYSNIYNESDMNVLASISVSLINPINYFNSSIPVSFNCTTNSGSNISNISLYGNWSGGWHKNYTMYTIYQENPDYNTSSGWNNATRLYDGDWSSYTYQSGGGAGNYYPSYLKQPTYLNAIWQVKYSFVTTYYTVNYTVPTICFNQNNLSFNIRNYIDSRNGDYVTVGFCWSGSDWEVIYSNNSGANLPSFYEEAIFWNVAQTNNTFMFLNSTIPDGQYIYNCYACDINNNCAFSISNQTFSVDTTYPNITIDTPTNNSYFNYVPYLNGTCNDSGTGLNYIYTNATEYSGLDGTSPFNFTNLSTLTNKIYNIKISCNDSANNINSTLVNFTYDNILPWLNYSSPTPANNTIQTTSADLIVNVTAIDTNPSYIWMTLSNLTGNANQPLTNISNQTWLNNTNISFSIYALSNGNYSYNITACDLAGNCNTTANYKINISYLDVSAHINYPSINGEVVYTSLSGPPHTFNFTYIATYSGTLNCTFNLTGCSSDIATTNINCSAGTQNITINAFSSLCTLSVSAFNYTNNKNATDTRTFSVVTSAPPAPPGGGGGVVVPPLGNTTWTMQTEEGTGNYHFSMGYGGTRTRNIKFFNTGTTAKTITLSCSGNLCKYINFSKTSISLPVGLEIATYSAFTVAIPEIETVKNMTGNLIGTDNSGLQNILTIQVDLGQSNVFLDIINKFPSDKRIGTIGIPYWAIFLIVWGIFFFASFLIFRKLPIGIFLSVLISLILAFIVMAFI